MSVITPTYMGWPAIGTESSTSMMVPAHLCHNITCQLVVHAQWDRAVPSRAVSSAVHAACARRPACSLRRAVASVPKPAPRVAGWIVRKLSFASWVWVVISRVYWLTCPELVSRCVWLLYLLKLWTTKSYNLLYLWLGFVKALISNHNKILNEKGWVLFFIF